MLWWDDLSGVELKRRLTQRTDLSDEEASELVHHREHYPHRLLIKETLDDE